MLIETPFSFNSLIDLSDLREVSSMINCEVLRESLSVSINLFFYYNSLADLILVFTLWRIPLKFAKSCGLLDLMALIFSTSRMCMRCFKSIEIQGEFLERIRLERIGAGFSTISRNFVFHSDQSWLGSSIRFKNSQSRLQISLPKSEQLKLLKLL